MGWTRSLTKYGEVENFYRCRVVNYIAGTVMQGGIETLKMSRKIYPISCRLNIFYSTRDNISFNEYIYIIRYNFIENINICGKNKAYGLTQIKNGLEFNELNK